MPQLKLLRLMTGPTKVRRLQPQMAGVPLKHLPKEKRL